MKRLPSSSITASPQREISASAHSFPAHKALPTSRPPHQHAAPHPLPPAKPSPSPDSAKRQTSLRHRLTIHLPIHRAARSINQPRPRKPPHQIPTPFQSIPAYKPPHRPPFPDAAQCTTASASGSPSTAPASPTSQASRPIPTTIRNTLHIPSRSFRKTSRISSPKYPAPITNNFLTPPFYPNSQILSTPTHQDRELQLAPSTPAINPSHQPERPSKTNFSNLASLAVKKPTKENLAPSRLSGSPPSTPAQQPQPINPSPSTPAHQPQPINPSPKPHPKTPVFQLITSN